MNYNPNRTYRTDWLTLTENRSVGLVICFFLLWVSRESTVPVLITPVETCDLLMFLLWDIYGWYLFPPCSLKVGLWGRATRSWLRFMNSSSACFVGDPAVKLNFHPKNHELWSAVLLYGRSFHATVQMCLSTPTVQKFFPISFLIYYTLANDLRPRDQEYTLAHSPVESFIIDDSALTEPSLGNQPIPKFGDTSSETVPNSQGQIWIKDVASLFMVGRPGTHCTSNNAQTSLDQLLPPSRFQRRRP